MNQRKRWLLPLLLVAALLLAACGGGAEPAPAPAPDAVAEPTDEPQAEEPEPTEAPAPTATAEPTATPEPTEAPATEMDLSGARTLDEIDEISSFRMMVSILAQGEAFESGDGANMGMLGGEVSIEAEVVKEPPAQHLTMRLGGEDGGMLGDIEFILVDDQGYGSFGGTWVQSDASEVPNLDELTLININEMENIDQLEQVGTETVNGRETTHLRGDKETFQNMSQEDQLGLENAETVEVDIWIDQEYGFLVKMTVLAEGTGLNEELPDAEGRLEMTLEYSDFNETFDIQAPEVSDSLNLDVPDMSGDLTEMLGFELALPEGSEVFVFGTTGSITLPLPVDEANEFIVSAMEDAGYTLNEAESFVDSGIYTFELDGTAIDVFVSEGAEEGTTDITILTGE